MNMPAIPEELLDLHRQAEDIVALAESQRRDLTTAEQLKFDNITRQFGAFVRVDTGQRFGDVLDRAEALGYPCPSMGRLTEPQTPEPQNRRPDEVPTQSPHRHPGAAMRAWRHEADLPMRILPGSTTFASLRGYRGASSDGFQAGEFLRGICSGMHDPRFQPLDQGMSEGTGAGGGFLVPSYLSDAIFDQSLTAEVIRPLANIQVIAGGNEYTAPVVDMSDRATFAGLSAQWTPEGGEGTAQALALKQIAGKAKKLMLLVRTSNELAADAPNFEKTLGSAMSQQLSYALDSSFIRGTGVGTPLGILNAPSKITVAKESGQAADSLTFVNLIGMWSRMIPSSTAKAIWLGHPSILPQLLAVQQKVKNAAGTDYVGGSGAFIVNTVAETPRMSLFGRPLILTEHASALGDEGDLILVDLSQYLVILRAELGLVRDPFSLFSSDSSLWRLIVRIDGLPIWSNPVVPERGDTLSWCITLADRT